MTETTLKVQDTKAWYTRVWDILTGAHSSITDIAQRRTAQLLAGLSLSIGLIDLLGIVGTPKRFTDPQEAPTLYLLGALAAVMLLVYGLSRTRFYSAAIFLTMASISGLVFMSPIIGEKDPVGFALSVLPLSFLLAFGLLSLRGIIILSLVNSLVPMLLPVFIPNMSWDYSGTVGGVSMAFGALLVTVFATRTAIERGRMAEMKRVNQELQEISATLEDRIADRTRDMVLAAEVGRRIATMHNLETMLSDAVELIRERFDLYYTQVYLLDQPGRNLVLRAGTGEVGKELLRRAHRLPMGQTSINATAAAERRAVVVEDTPQSLIFLPNPLLQATCSEMSVPLVAGDRVLGVLDLQSREPGKLTYDTLPVFDTLAGQLATALVNAQLFEQVEQSLAEVELRSRKTTRQGWDEFLNAVDAKERIGYVYDHRTVSPLAEPMLEMTSDPCVLAAPIHISGEQVGTLQLAADHTWSVGDTQVVAQVAAQVAQQVENLRLLGQAERYREEAEEAVRRLTRDDWKEFLETVNTTDLAFKYAQDQVQPLAEVDGDSPNGALHLQIKVRDEQIGEFAFPALENLSPEDADLVAAISEQLGAHLENMRLYSTARQEVEERRRAEEIVAKRAEQLATVSRLSTLVSTIQLPEEMLQTVVDLTKANFDLYHAHIYLVDADGDGLVLAKGAGEVGRQMVAEGRRIPMNTEKSLVARSARTREGLIVNNVTEDPDFLPHPLLPHTRSEMAVPMIAGDVLLGVLDVQSDVLNRFTEEDIQINTTLSSQVAVALENARQYAQTQESERLIRTVIDSTPDWIFIKDHQHRYRLVNQGYANSLHLKVEDFIGKTDLDLGFPEDYVKGNPEKGIRGYWADDRAVMDGEEALLFPNDPSMLDGVLHVFNTLKTPLRDQNGNIWGVLAFARDVTEREQLLQEMEAQRHTLAEVMAAAKIANWEFDVASGCFTFNDGYYALLGTSIEEQGTYTLPAPVFGERFVHPEDNQDIGMRIGLALQATDPNYQTEFEARLLHKNGQYITVLVTLQVFKDEEGRTVRLFGANQDISERKLAEAEIESQRRTLQVVLDNMPAGVFMVEAPSGRPILSNKKAEEFLGRGISPNAVGEDLNQVYQAYKYGTETLYPAEEMPVVAGLSGEARNIDDMEVIRPDGSRILLQVVGTPIFDANGKVIASVVLFSDITELRKANDEIRRTEQLYRQILDSTPDFVLVKGPKSQIIWANKAFRAYYGMTNEQLKDIIASPAEEPDYTQKYIQDDEWVFREGKILTIPEEPVTRYDGEIRPFQTVKAPIFDENGQVVMTVGVMRDMSEAKKTQELLAKRAVELATVAEISTRVSTIQHPDEMLQMVVDLTRQAFMLYHAHIYLMDETSEKLLLAKGSGEIGRKMVAEGRSISMRSEKSLVVRAARTRQGVIVNNVREDPDFLPHPLLPDTHSEMAVPMIAGDRLLGVIDVQDIQEGRFSPEDINILTTLAAQVAIGLQNARSYARAQRQAEREALINAISERIQATNTVESALQVAVREIGRALGAQHTAIRLGLERKKENE